MKFRTYWIVHYNHKMSIGNKTGYLKNNPMKYNHELHQNLQYFLTIKRRGNGKNKVFLINKNKIVPFDHYQFNRKFFFWIRSCSYYDQFHGLRFSIRSIHYKMIHLYRIPTVRNLHCFVEMTGQSRACLTKQPPLMVQS